MPAPLVVALREQRMASPFSEPDDLIFPSERGTPLDGGNMVRREFTPALRRARLPQIRFHDLRHTFTSLLIRQGVHPKVIQEKLGHASIQTTLDRYGHLMQGLGDATVEESLYGAEPASTLQAFDRQSVPQRAASPLASVADSA